MDSMTYIAALDVFDFISTLQDGSVDLFLTDPPYMNIVEDSWDNQWSSVQDYVTWMMRVLEAIKPKMKENGSILFFGGVGKHGERPFFKLMEAVEAKGLYHYRNLITWKKRRAYGKSHDYLFCREEIAWYSMSPERTKVTFHIPLTDIKRGYTGFKQDTKVGYSTIYCHTPHEDQTSSCMSSRSQTQSKGDVLLMLRQAAVPQRPQSQDAETPSLVAQEQGTSIGLLGRMEEAQSHQKDAHVAPVKRQKTRYSLQLDRGRLEGSVDRSVSSARNSNPSQQNKTKQLAVSGSDQQLCWVCTRQHLRNVLESKQAQDGCYNGGVGGSGSIHEIELTTKQIKYAAKSEYKRVSNVWDDIPELMRPERNTQKPIPLMERFIKTHSNPGDLVVDPFSGWGSTGVAALRLGRRFQGSERIVEDAKAANERCEAVAKAPPLVTRQETQEQPIVTDTENQEG